MYTPAAFEVSELPKLHQFMESNSFAVLCSSHAGQVRASHLPMLLDRSIGPNGRLLGHTARANDQWQTAAGTEVLVVFSGPHAYISPTWYEAENTVPTWNYVAVHAAGTLELIEDREPLLEIIGRTVSSYEGSRPKPWTLDDAGRIVDSLLPMIVGFSIDISRLEGKWKLNQNHSVERREKVARALDRQPDENSRAISALIRETLGAIT